MSSCATTWSPSKNVHTYKELADWIGAEVANRMDDDGVLHVLGTRMGANDLYSELRDLRSGTASRQVWTYFAQPAVLEMPEPHPSTWVTLWPEKWPGESLVKLKAEATDVPAGCSRISSMDASMDQVFPTGAVMASIDKSRASGPMSNLYCVLGVDPAAAGFTAMVVMGVDRATSRRFVLDGFNMARTPPELLIQKIMHFVQAYNVREVLVERNAFQGFLSRQQVLRDFCYSHGALLTEHYTGAQKWDDDLGVSAMSPLFLSCADHDPVADTWTRRPTENHLISLPAPKFSTFVDEMVTQLTTWQPRVNKRAQHTKTDLVMALWFANIGVQKVIDQAKNVPRFMSNEFITRADARQRNVVNLHELREAQLRGVQEVSFHTGERL
jgi:hypothetical protein